MKPVESPETIKDNLARRIGRSLKTFRQEAGLSQKYLAETVDLSSTLISRIENGLLRPSLATLELIANSLKVDIGHFFRDEEQTRYMVSFKGKRRTTVSKRGYDRIELLVEGVNNAFMEPAVVTAKGKEQEDKVRLTIHNGQEFMYVLEGTLELTVGSKKYILRKEDAAYWHGDIPHRGISLSKKPAKTLNVHLIPGKRVGTFKSPDD